MNAHRRRGRIFAVIALLVLTISHGVSFIFGIGVIDLTISTVYWGTNQQAPYYARPGDTNEYLSVVVTNIGDSPAFEINATLLLNYPFSYGYESEGRNIPVSNVSAYAGFLLPSQSQTMRYTLNIDPSASEGVYRMKLVFSYKTQSDVIVVMSKYVDIPVYVGSIHVQNVSTVPTKVYPDFRDVNYKLIMVNSGDATAKDVLLQLLLKYPFSPASSGSDRTFLGAIPAGGTAEANFYLDVDKKAAGGYYDLQLEVTTAFAQQGTIIHVPFFVNEKVRFQVVEVTPASLYAGESGAYVTVVLRNNGNETADSVRAQLRIGTFFKGTTSDFLGTIHPGETKTAVFQLDVDYGAIPQIYIMDLHLDWTQGSTAQPTALDDTIPLKLIVAPFLSGIRLLVVSIVFLLMAMFVFLVVSARRKGMTVKQAFMELRKKRANEESRQQG